MRAFRICQTKYANDLNGTGAKLYGGRWNHIGTPCIYSADSRALAVLEFSVNVQRDLVPKNLSLCVFEFEESVVQNIDEQKLPHHWHQIPASTATKNFGSKLLTEGHAVIKIPSSVIRDEFNFIINPLFQTDFNLIEIKDFSYDLRIKNF